MTNHSALSEHHCRPHVTALTPAEISDHLLHLPDWQVEHGMIKRSFSFTNYYETLAFTNALAWMVHAQDHHPELIITYNRCIVCYNTHSVNDGKGGISENDFICAAKVDAIYRQQHASSAKQ